MNAKTTVYEVVTSRIIDMLSKGTVPWRQTWKRGPGQLPRNFLTKKAYRGINVIILWSAGFSSPDFLTFRQAKQLGGSVRKGEHGLPVIFWSVYDGKSIDAKTGKPEKRFVLRYYTVFHVSQCDGLNVPAEVPALPAVEPIEACEKVAAGYVNPPSLSHGGDRAYYRPATDAVQMPPRESFDSIDAYYATLFHEFGHSTGAAKRLNRKGIAKIENFGSHSYSFEELVAECTAAFLCAETGIATSTLDNSAAYIKHWITALQSEPKWLIEAAGQAAKATDHILGRSAKPETSDEAEAA